MSLSSNKMNRCLVFGLLMMVSAGVAANDEESSSSSVLVRSVRSLTSASINEDPNVRKLQFEYTFTGVDGVGPITGAPSETPTSPVEDEEESGSTLEDDTGEEEDGETIGFARATGQEQNTNGNERNLKTLYPAVIAGVIAMFLTMIVIGRRRRTRALVGDDNGAEMTIEQIKAAPVEIDLDADEEGGGWVEHMPDGQTTIQVSEMEPTPADVAAAAYNPSRYHVQQGNHNTGTSHDNSGGVDDYYHHHHHGSSPQPQDSAGGYILRTASSYDSQYNSASEGGSYNSNGGGGGGNGDQYATTSASGIIQEYYDGEGNLLPSIHYGNGQGYESEGDSTPYIPERGTVKRVDMSGNVRETSEIWDSFWCFF